MDRLLGYLWIGYWKGLDMQYPQINTHGWNHGRLVWSGMLDKLVKFDLNGTVPF